MTRFLDTEGREWTAAVVSHGRTSGYLNRRVHRAMVQFVCQSARLPRRYVGYDVASSGPLEELSEAELRDMLERASVH
jgi:hypothetical protein